VLHRMPCTLRVNQARPEDPHCPCGSSLVRGRGRQNRQMRQVTTRESAGQAEGAASHPRLSPGGSGAGGVPGPAQDRRSASGPRAGAGLGILCCRHATRRVGAIGWRACQRLRAAGWLCLRPKAASASSPGRKPGEEALGKWRNTPPAWHAFINVGVQPVGRRVCSGGLAGPGPLFRVRV
jgi:hypothetical protein